MNRGNRREEDTSSPPYYQHNQHRKQQVSHHTSLVTHCLAGCQFPRSLSVCVCVCVVGASTRLSAIRSGRESNHHSKANIPVVTNSWHWVSYSLLLSFSYPHLLLPSPPPPFPLPVAKLEFLQSDEDILTQRNSRGQTYTGEEQSIYHWSLYPLTVRSFPDDGVSFLFHPRWFGVWNLVLRSHIPRLSLSLSRSEVT